MVFRSGLGFEALAAMAATSSSFRVEIRRVWKARSEGE
jgi:hypothetical protein